MAPSINMHAPCLLSWIMTDYIIIIIIIIIIIASLKNWPSKPWSASPTSTKKQCNYITPLSKATKRWIRKHPSKSTVIWRFSTNLYGPQTQLCSQTHIPVTLQPKKRHGYKLHETLDWLPSWSRCGNRTSLLHPLSVTSLTKLVPRFNRGRVIHSSSVSFVLSTRPNTMLAMFQHAVCSPDMRILPSL